MNVKKFLKKKTKTDMHWISGQVEESLFKKVNTRRANLDISWNRLLDAMFNAFLEDTSKRKNK